jgi:hypothetical protein
MGDFLYRRRMRKNDIDNVFDVDGIRFGLEICLDHRRNVFWERLQEDNDNLVDVHHVISDGMVLDLCTALSAACLRTDNDKYDPQNVCQEGPAGLKHVPALRTEKYRSHLSLATS